MDEGPWFANHPGILAGIVLLLGLLSMLWGAILESGGPGYGPVVLPTYSYGVFFLLLGLGTVFITAPSAYVIGWGYRWARRRRARRAGAPAS